MTAAQVCLLVVAKAPVPGLAKTRLAAAIGDHAAAEVAAAALLDTLDAMAAAQVAARVIALTGDLDFACRAAELRARMADFIVIEQRGDGFAERLANAHADAAVAAGSLPVFQIGMDTPQVSADLLSAGARRLLEASAVLGLACDGGWWALGVRDPVMAQCLRGVPMSQSDTGAVTLRALADTAVDVRLLPELHDVDTIDDVAVVRALCATESRFTRTTAGIGLGDVR